MSTTQEWCFDPTTARPHGPKPTPRRLRKLLRREEETLESLQPGSTTAETPPPPEEGRDAGGRFAKGNKGGTGNPFARQVAGFRAALVNAATEADFTEIAQVLLTKAKGGDLSAIKLFLSYTIGKPAAPPDPDRLALEDFQLLRERLATLEEDWHLLRKMVPVEGIVEAGHRVADLRAAWWREDVLGQPAPAAPPKGTAAGGGRNPALLREALAVIETEPDVSAEWKSTTMRMLTEADEAGCLYELLDALRTETDKSLEALHGTGAHLPPSANGCTAAEPPSPNGRAAAGVPSANGHTVAHPPSPNGEYRQAAPSVNGLDGAPDGESDRFGRAKP